MVAFIMLFYQWVKQGDGPVTHAMMDLHFQVVQLFTWREICHNSIENLCELLAYKIDDLKNVDSSSPLLMQNESSLNSKNNHDDNVKIYSIINLCLPGSIDFYEVNSSGC